MNIYVDYDDCLCETARRFSLLVAELFEVDVPYEKIRYFDLQRSFALTEDQYEYLMTEGHKPEVLLSYEETPGAVEIVNSWVDSGHTVSIITGRPYSAFEASRAWLDRHGLDRVKLYCLNKYGRDAFIKDSEFSLEIEDYKKMPFDFAVEDSPSAFHFFDHLPDLKVMVYDRPWNQNCEFPTAGFRRCYDWETIRSEAKKIAD
ncbi:MAG: 2-dehydropantoate 2-reductase [Eubacterium sp.]|nr:2-dehydropantoate 2-reductase [Eubacterium sp.]